MPEESIASAATTINIKLKNLIDNDVKSMLLPINLMQNILLNRKYYIRCNFIYPNGFIYKCVSFCWMSTFLALKLYRVYEIFSDKYISLDSTPTHYVDLYLDTPLCSFEYTVNFFINAVKSEQYVLFVLKFQKVCRLLDNGAGKARNFISNWLFCIVLLLYHGLLRSTYIFVMGMQWTVAISLLSHIFNDANIIFAIVSIKQLTAKVIQWNLQVSRRDCFHDINCETLFKAYVNILECFEIFKDCFQFPVSYRLILIVLLKMYV